MALQLKVTFLLLFLVVLPLDGHACILHFFPSMETHPLLIVNSKRALLDHTKLLLTFYFASFDVANTQHLTLLLNFPTGFAGASSCEGGSGGCAAQTARS